MYIEVGQKLFAVFTGYGSVRSKEIEVTKVGRKWAYFGSHEKFDMETGWIDGYGGGKVYANSTEYEHEKAMDKLWDEIVKATRYARRPPKLTLADLSRLKELVC